MTPSEIDLLTKAVFKSAEIDTSSDFIVTLWELSKRTDDGMFERVDPIYGWEYSNWRELWYENVHHIEKKMQNLDVLDYIEIERAYTDVIEYLLETPALSRIFPIDDKDHVGWKIFKELSEKRNIAKYFLAIIQNTNKGQL
jgi:hypothetical protein